MAADACGHPKTARSTGRRRPGVRLRLSMSHINLAGFVNTEGGETGEATSNTWVSTVSGGTETTGLNRGEVLTGIPEGS